MVPFSIFFFFVLMSLAVATAMIFSLKAVDYMSESLKLLRSIDSKLRGTE
ncbi:MAG: hypothetical protein P9M00_02995 [Candidatus Tritonobacter lacicola]|nr:hypothetical protein [Candidatus Tritonobacter lacicola]